MTLWLVMLITITATTTTTTVVVQAQASCNYESDTCHYQFDGECDAGVYCDANSDCFDCDPCSGFNFDCGLCVAAGCYWCPGDAVCASSPIGPAVWDLHPTKQPSCRLAEQWQQTCTPAATGVNETANFFTDPLYDSMEWMFSLIHLQDVWAQGFTGQGVHVRVNDDGVDATHAEFAANFDVATSCASYLPNDFTTDKHGTGCASIIAGNKNNDACAVGIAPDVTLSACNGPSTLAGATELFNTHLEVVDVISNSWGPLPCESTLNTARRLQQRFLQQQCPFDLNHPQSPCNICGMAANYAVDALTAECEQAITSYCSTLYELDPVACGEYLDLYVSCSYHALDPVNQQGFAQVIADGRGGLGPIITFAGGNDYKIGVDANGDGMINSRYTIGVAAVGKDGLHASYSTVGAALLVAAPGGDEEAISNNIVANPGGGCHDITVGTSFATPVVSAVAALMLQANPNLGWRDVQGILAVTSQRVDFEDSSWYTNKAGISHSYKYGFGLIDASAAVAFSQTWENWDPEKQILKESGVIDVAIADATTATDKGASALSTLTITQSDVFDATGVNNIALESVVVYLDLQHGSRGDLQIVLTSPSGTKSILAPSKRPENTILTSDERWKLMTLRNWGENPIGDWTLDIADEDPGILSNCVNLPWQYSVDGVLYDCSDLEKQNVQDCSSPSEVPFVLQQGTFNGQKITDNCCICGGGVDATAIDQKLRSWRMIAYGHLAPETPAPTTLAPTSLPPTVAPKVPTQAPTATPGTCIYYNETSLKIPSGPLNIAIPDAGGGVLVSNMQIDHPGNLTVDNIEVFLNITHQSIGDLRVSLKTGQGTDIILAPGNRATIIPQPAMGQSWDLSTCDASGEPTNGEWALSIEDTNLGNSGNGTVAPGVVDMLESWGLILYSYGQLPTTLPPTPPPTPATTQATVNATVTTTPPPNATTTPPPISPERGVGNVTSNPITRNVTSAPVNTSAPTTTQPTAGSTLPPAALSRAVVMTIAPNVTNSPFITSGTSGTVEVYDRAQIVKHLLLAAGMSFSLLLM